MRFPSHILTLLFLASFCIAATPSARPTESALLCTIYFYTGDNVGERWRTTGPQMSVDGGKSWQNMAWDTIITSGLAVCPYGKYLYTACGNGVLASSDGGRNWSLSESWTMAEIQDMALNPENPLQVWAAGAYGLYYSDDGGSTWSRPGDPQPFRYTDCIVMDRENPNHLLIGTEEGLYITSDSGQTYVKIDPSAAVRSIWQDMRDSAIFWVGTDGDGIWKSVDGGKSFASIESPDKVVNKIIQHPENPSEILCGIYHGVGISRDNGVTWDVYTNGFGEFSPVYALLVDKNDPNLIYAGARDGFYVSNDRGVNWSHYTDENGDIVLENAVIKDLWQGDLYRGDEEPPSDAPGTLEINSTAPTGEEYRDDFVENFDKRARDAAVAMADQCADRLANLEEGAHVDLFQAIPLIREGRASDELWNDLRARFSDFGHSMFDGFPAISFYEYTKEYLPDDIKGLIRDGLCENKIYRGDTENHWLMYYTTLLLACQEWPETSARDWFTGRSTQENYDDAAGWINEWTRITTTIGQGEFDSPHYFNTYMAPSLLLYEFAEDPSMVRQAGMIVDLLLADMVVESLEGRYCGGHSRMYDPTVVRGDYDTAATYAYLYFGGLDLPEEFHSWALNGVYSSYRCPRVIADTAWTDQRPYVHTEVKRVRNQMRYSELLNSPVYKYTYMTDDYGIGSLQGGILQPIQQHTWDVTWKGSAANTTLFSLHPYYSAYELAMFFPEDPHMLTASVQAQKGTYTNPQKLCSSSPFERTFQHESTIIVAYNIPDGTTHNHVTLYVPDCLNRQNVGNWIIGEDAEDAEDGEDSGTYIAVYICTPGEWYNEPNEDFPPAQRMQIPAGQTAIICEVASASEGITFDEFLTEISSLNDPVFEKTDSGPIVTYANRHGDIMKFTWDGELRELNGEVWDYPKDKLFNGPFVNSDINSRVIQITANGITRTLNFNNLAIVQ